MTMNKAQQKALFAVFCRDNPSAVNDFTGWQRAYRRFRRKAVYSFIGCWMIPWKGMWLGIEPDGYTHS